MRNHSTAKHPAHRVRPFVAASDLAHVLLIERDLFDAQRPAEYFLDYGRTGTRYVAVVERVAVNDGRIITGYAVYENHQTYCELHTLAVDSGCRRLGLGCLLAQAVLFQAVAKSLRSVRCYVSAKDWIARVFIQAVGFRSVNSVNGDLRYVWTV